MRFIDAKIGMAAALASVGGGAALAHHSGAMFDHTRVITLRGTVKTFDWKNPHTIIWLNRAPEAKGGKPELWFLEMTSPSRLARDGWTKRTLNPGDAIVVETNPLRDGRPGGRPLKITVVGTGKVYEIHL